MSKEDLARVGLREIKEKEEPLTEGALRTIGTERDTKMVRAILRLRKAILKAVGLLEINRKPYTVGSEFSVDLEEIARIYDRSRKAREILENAFKSLTITYKEKPPLGIILKWRWLEIRGRELALAINRYMNAGRLNDNHVDKWSNELQDIIKQIKDCKGVGERKSLEERELGLRMALSHMIQMVEYAYNSSSVCSPNCETVNQARLLIKAGGKE